jgi:hypothetical protein
MTRTAVNHVTVLVWGKSVRLKCCECYEACCGREESVYHLVRNTVFFGPQGAFLFLENTI